MGDFLDYLTEISGGGTRADFARAAGVSPPSVTRWNSSRANYSQPKAEHVIALALYYGRPITEALTAAGIIDASSDPAAGNSPARADARARAAIRRVTDADLVAELQRRLARTSDPSSTMAGQEDPDAYDLAAGAVARPDDQPAD